MTTDKTRVATYLSEELEEAFNRFKLEHRLGDSQALIAILTDYFELPSAHPISPQRFEELATKVEKLTKQVEDLRQYIEF